MKVSIVIPTYNRSRYITDTVDSILNQSFTDYEIIIINDGSTDNTEEVLEPYKNKIKYLKTKNQGIAVARNEGMKLATGEYIAQLDDDDLYYPYKLDLQVTILENHPDIALVYTEFSGFDDESYFDEWHLKTYHSSAYKRGGLSYDKIFNKKIPLENYPAITKALTKYPSEFLNKHVYFGNIYDRYLMNTIVFTNSIMFRRSILDKTGLQEQKFGLFHDLEFVLRICKQHAVAFIDIPTYKLRYHPGQISITHGTAGTKNAIKKQRNLLHVTKLYALNDEEYYAAHKENIDTQLAALYRAVAIPLISYKSNNKHKTKYYPRRARAYLNGCKQHHKPQYLLLFLSYLPHIFRRISFKIMEINKQRKNAKLYL